MEESFKNLLEKMEAMSDEDFNRIIEEMNMEWTCDPDTCEGQCQGFGSCDVAKDFQLESPESYFVILKHEQKKLDEWMKEHECDLVNYSGAIGGRLTYSFTPTSVGCITRVTCGCGDEITLTDFNDW